MLSEIQKHLIVEHFKNGQTIDQIAATMKINRKTVIRWVNRYGKEHTIERKKRIYNKCTTKEQNSKILSLVQDTHKIKLQAIVNILKNEEIEVSKTTVWRRLKDEQCVYGSFLNKPRLSEEQRTNRLA